MAALTPADVDRLKAKLDAGDRAGFYLLYHDLTGSNQALTQAEISSFSGELGRQAMHTNAAVQAYLWADKRADQYPGPVENFSQKIAKDLYDRIAEDVENGGTGIFRDREIFDFAKETWKNNKIGDCFPGNLVDPEVPSAPRCSRVAATLGGMRAAAEWLDAIVPMAPGIPPGGRQLTTADGQATYIVDSRGMVVPGSVQRIQAAPRPFDFNGTQPDDHGQINAPGWAGQAASVAPNNGGSFPYPWPGITAGGMPPWIPALAPPPPSAPIGPFDWLQPDLLGKVGGLPPGGGFGPPPSNVARGVGAPFSSPQGFDFGGIQAWPSVRSLDGSGTLDIYHGTVPPLPYLPSGPFGGGLMPRGALGPPQPNPLEGRAFSAPLPQTPMTPPQVPASPPSPFGVPIPEALRPLVPFLFPQGFDTATQSWPSTGTPDGAGAPVSSSGAGLDFTRGPMTSQQSSAPPTPPIDAPIPEALRPLVRLSFP